KNDNCYLLFKVHLFSFGCFNFFFCCFGLVWLPTVGGHFRPFTEVLRKFLRSLTRKVWEQSPDYPPWPVSYGGRQRMSRVRTVKAAVSAALSGLKRRRRHACHNSLLLRR